MKVYEGLESDRRLMPGLPILARLDGRAFHTFCQGLHWPYDKRLHQLMVDVTCYLVAETNALVGYTQSDEISLVWFNKDPTSETLFGGRANKMATVIAAMATAKFVRLLPDRIPEKAEALPVFDGRVWAVPNKAEAANVFLWRELDATRNSIASVAQAHFSHEELHGKNTNEIQEMLFQQHGINWGRLPPSQKRGTWVRKVRVDRHFQQDDISHLPPKHHARTQPNLRVERWEVQAVSMPRFPSIKNRESVIFDQALPDYDHYEEPAEVLALDIQKEDDDLFIDAIERRILHDSQ